MTVDKKRNDRVRICFLVNREILQYFFNFLQIFKKMPKCKHLTSDPCILDATKNGHCKCVKSLVKKGADVNVTDTDENGRSTPLISAALN